MKNIKKKEITLIFLPQSKYKQQQINITKDALKKFKRICYVNTTINFDTLIKNLQKHKIDDSKFLFIDSTSKKSNHQNCITLLSLQALTELSLTIKKAISTGKFDLIIFDSLCTLLTYHNSTVLTKFTHDLFAAIKKANIATIFTLPNNMDQNFIADISMFSDQVIGSK